MIYLRIQSPLRGLWALLTCAAPGYYSQCLSDTTSTVVKAPLVCAWLVKRRYTKYPALPFLQRYKLYTIGGGAGGVLVTRSPMS